MGWRLALSLEELRDEINRQFPERSTASDGTIGDPKHQARSSDHNAWIKIKENGKTVGIVTALDITHDPSVGLSSQKLAEALAASRDPRIKYIISNRRIISGNDGPSPWVWRNYDGANPHDKHMHISVEDKQSLFDNVNEWRFAIEKTDHVPTTGPVLPLLKKGSKGDMVERLQRLLIKEGHILKVDGDFGNKTDRAVREFQKTNGLEPDGKVGPYTWEKLV